MKPLGLISQIFAIAVAVAIVLLFVRPSFTDIGSIQEEISQYAQERGRVADTNAVLAARTAELESIPLEDRARLATYMPMLIDEVAVMRDIEIIAQSAGVTYNSITYNGELVDDSDEARLAATEETIIIHDFSLSVSGSYSRIKDFLSLLEQNHYPLQVYMLGASATEGGSLQADINIATYTTERSVAAEQ